MTKGNNYMDVLSVFNWCLNDTICDMFGDVMHARFYVAMVARGTILNEYSILYFLNNLNCFFLR